MSQNRIRNSELIRIQEVINYLRIYRIRIHNNEENRVKQYSRVISESGSRSIRSYIQFSISSSSIKVAAFTTTEKIKSGRPVMAQRMKRITRYIAEYPQTNRSKATENQHAYRASTTLVTK